MEAIPYLQYTSKGLFKYRRRTPKELLQYIYSKEIIRSLGTQQTEAIQKAININSVISEAIKLTKLEAIPKSIIFNLLADKLQIKPLEDQQIQSKEPLSYSIKLYLEQSNVTSLEYANRVYFFKSLLPTILEVLLKKDDININELSYDVILDIRKLLLKLPNKNYSNYKTMSLKELVSSVHKKTLCIPENHLNSIDTTNKNLKRIKSLLLFTKDLGLYRGNIPKTITIQQQETSSRNFKAILNYNELQNVLANTNDDIKFIYEVLYYTGMRRSELYKCSIVEIDNILCFDLRSPSQALKTKSSYRVIPVHKKLMYKIDKYQDIISSIKSDRLTKTFTRLLQKLVHEPQNKSLYSLRHTFATNLIAKNILPEVVSELMGHSHTTMTMNRYVKGFPIYTLQKAINEL